MVWGVSFPPLQDTQSCPLRRAWGPPIGANRPCPWCPRSSHTSVSYLTPSLGLLPGEAPLKSYRQRAWKAVCTRQESMVDAAS